MFWDLQWVRCELVVEALPFGKQPGGLQLRPVGVGGASDTMPRDGVSLPRGLHSSKEGELLTWAVWLEDHAVQLDRPGRRAAQRSVA